MIIISLVVGVVSEAPTEQSVWEYLKLLQTKVVLDQYHHIDEL
jgi:hypothetical protein